MSRHVSQIYTALFDLSADNQIKLEFSEDVSPNLHNYFRCNTLWIEARKTETSRAYTVCFDMRDQSNLLIDLIKKAEFYFKRSYRQNDVKKLDENLRNKVFPFGLYYPCRSDNERISLNTFKTIYLNNKIFYKTYFTNKVNKRSISYCYRNRRNIFDYTKYLLTPESLIHPSSCPLLSEIEVKSKQPAEKKILFMTRVWPTNGSHLDIHKELNDMRVETIKALQSAFGDKFIGGLIPTKFAEKNYPHLLAREKTKKKIYLKYVRKCLITITTRGLSNSTGAKLPEYIAASRCIVTEPLLNELPSPLEEGRHILTFSNPDECVEACKRILDDPELARQMRKNNEQYYKRELMPQVLISKRLDTVLSTLSK